MRILTLVALFFTATAEAGEPATRSLEPTPAYSDTTRVQSSPGYVLQRQARTVMQRETRQVQVPVTVMEKRTIQVPRTIMEDKIVDCPVQRMETRTVEVDVPTTVYEDVCVPESRMVAQTVCTDTRTQSFTDDHHHEGRRERVLRKRLNRKVSRRSKRHPVVRHEVRQETLGQYAD